jgi:hypothetical protein
MNYIASNALLIKPKISFGLLGKITRMIIPGTVCPDRDFKPVISRIRSKTVNKLDMT